MPTLREKLKGKYKFKEKKKADATYILISICIGVFIIETILYHMHGKMFLQSIFSDYGFSLRNILDGKYYTFLTSIFLHADSMHLILNMIALFFFGRAIEEELGWKHLLIVFFCGGIIGNIGVMIAAQLGIMSSMIVTVGASGAIFALLGAAIFVKPLEFVFFPYIIPVPLILVALIYVLFNITEFISYLGGEMETGIAYASHIAGLIFGALYGFKKIGEKKSLIIIISLVALLILLPFIWEYLQMADYTNLLSASFK